MTQAGHETRRAHGYEITVHPAAVSRAVLDGDAGERVLYEQAETHRFPAGERHPPRHVVRLLGGPHQRNVTLTVDDPEHHVAEIVIRLYPHPRDPMSTDPAPAPVETLTLENDPETCPPHCTPL